MIDYSPEKTKNKKHKTEEEKRIEHVNEDRKLGGRGRGEEIKLKNDLEVFSCIVYSLRFEKL